MFHAVAAGFKDVAIFPPDAATARADARTYAEHNVTAEYSDGEIKGSPNAHSQQCQCPGCSRHRRRAPVTQTADKGKSVEVVC